MKDPRILFPQDNDLPIRAVSGLRAAKEGSDRFRSLRPVSDAAWHRGRVYIDSGRLHRTLSQYTRVAGPASEVTDRSRLVRGAGLEGVDPFVQSQASGRPDGL